MSFANMGQNRRGACSEQLSCCTRRIVRNHESLSWWTRSRVRHRRCQTRQPALSYCRYFVSGFEFWRHVGISFL